MRIDDLLESISGRLPEGWSVRCGVGYGEAWVCAIDPDGEMHHIDSDEADIELQMEEAAAMAQRLSRDCASSSSDGYEDEIVVEIDLAWRSMESAPKDGTQILVYEPCAGVVVMFYADGAFREKVSMCTLRNAPTHWMPLPHGPKST